MAVNSNNVFLVSGQRTITVEGGQAELASRLEQFLVIAPSDVEAYGVLAVQEPNVTPVGHASLHSYEQAVAKIQAALSGQTSSWKVMRAQGMEAA